MNELFIAPMRFLLKSFVVVIVAVAIFYFMLRLIKAILKYRKYKSENT